MKKTKASRSKKEKVEEARVQEKVEEPKLNPNWDEEEIKLAKKYYELYKDLGGSDTFVLMLSYIPSKKPEQIACKLHELGVLTSEALFEHYPHLEDANSKSTTKKQSTSDSMILEHILKIEELNRIQWESISVSNPDWEKNTIRWDSFLQWLQEQFGEAILNKQFSEITIPESDSSSKSEPIFSPGFTLVPMQECEIECIKNRWGRKLLQALECTEQKTFWTGEELSNIWTIPDSISSAQLKKHLQLLKEAHKRISSLVEQRKKALSDKLNWKPSKASAPSQKQTTASNPLPKPATTTNEKPLQVANAKRSIRAGNSNKENKSANDIDSVFSSPEHKKTKS